MGNVVMTNMELTTMPRITEQQAINHELTEEKSERLTSQLDALVDALDDVLLVLRSGAGDRIKLMRIEDLETPRVKPGIAEKMLDDVLWFWSVDGVDPADGCVVRDAIAEGGGRRGACPWRGQSMPITRRSGRGQQEIR